MDFSRAHLARLMVIHRRCKVDVECRKFKPNSRYAQAIVEELTYPWVNGGGYRR